MSKITIEFTLPEEKEEHLRAVLADFAFSALYDIDKFLRDEIKSENSKLNKKTVIKIQDILFSIMADNGINLEQQYS